MGSHRCFAILALGSLHAAVRAKLLNIDSEDEDRTEPFALATEQLQRPGLQAVNDFVSARLHGGLDLVDNTKAAITRSISSIEDRLKRERPQKAKASTTPARTKKPAMKSTSGRPSFTARTGTASEKLKSVETEMEDVQKERAEMAHKVKQTKARVDQLSASYAKKYEQGTRFDGRVKEAQDMLSKTHLVDAKKKSENVAALELKIKTVMDQAFGAEQQMMKDVAALEVQLATDAKKASQDRVVDSIYGVIARTGTADAVVDA